MEDPGGSKYSSISKGSGDILETIGEGEKSFEQIHNIVNEFLKRHREGIDIKKGLTISEGTIELAITKLDRGINAVDINLLPKEYTQFLSEYGSICGKGHEICGPTGDDTTTNEKKAKYIASLQRGFKKNCKRLNKNQDELKFYWLIAEINNVDQYYIDLSKGGRIYSIDFEGNSRFFAEDFTDFLGRFFMSFENSDLST